MDKLTANELRIGNFVRLFLGVGDNGAEYKEYEINGVYTDQYGSSHWLLGNTWIQISDNLQPIPLTEEWLVKIGFQRDIDYFKLKVNEDLSIVYVGYLAIMVGGNINFLNSNLTHVHSLQNLYFALTSEELTITTN